MADPEKPKEEEKPNGEDTPAQPSSDQDDDYDRELAAAWRAYDERMDAFEQRLAAWEAKYGDKPDAEQPERPEPPTPPTTPEPEPEPEREPEERHWYFRKIKGTEHWGKKR